MAYPGSPLSPSRRAPSLLVLLRWSLLLLLVPPSLAPAEEARGTGGGPPGPALQAAREARSRGDHEGALRLAERAYEASLAPGERRDALRFLLILQISGHRWHAAHRLIPTLRRLEQELGNTHGVAACDVQMASVEASLGRLPSALARIQEAVAFFDLEGAPFERRGAHLNLGFPREADAEVK